MGYTQDTVLRSLPEREKFIFTYIRRLDTKPKKKIKVQQIKWTTAWRRHNKKIKATDMAKKKRRRAKKVVREIVGMTADEISRRKAETTNEKNARMSEATRQIKERRAKLAKANQASQAKNAPQKAVKNVKTKGKK